MKQITSLQNLYFRSLLQLQDKAKLSRQTGNFVIEEKGNLFGIDRF